MTLISSAKTDSTADIDPESFTITERADTDAKFAGMFVLARDGTTNIWRLKLDSGMSIDYGDTELPADKIIRLTVQVSDPEDTPSTTPREVEIRVVDDAVAPVLSVQGTGSIAENADGADSGIIFTLTDPDTTISYTATADTTDIDRDSFDITTRDGTNAKFLTMFELAEGDTADTWTWKLRDLMSLDYEDTDMPDDRILHFAVRVTDPDGNASIIRDIDVSVENVDEIAPRILSTNFHNIAYVTENKLGVVTSATMTVTDETTPGVQGDLKPSNFVITTRTHTHGSYADYFEFVRSGDSDIWRLKLKDGVSLDYEAPGLAITTSQTRNILLRVKVVDDAGNASAQSLSSRFENIRITILNQDPETTPTLNSHLRYNVATITENEVAAYTGLRFTVTDPDTTISTTGRTPDTGDIDPDSFDITARNDTDDKFARLFEAVRDGTSNTWEIKLRDGVSLDYEDNDLPAPEDSGNKRLDLAVSVSDDDGNTSTTWDFYIDVLDATDFTITGTLDRTHPENVGDETPLVTFKATSTVAAEAEVSYRITAGNVGGLFELVKDDAGNAVISLVSGRSLDYDTAPYSYTLNVEARTNIAGNTAISDIEVNIAITNINEHAPEFAASSSVQVDNVAENIGDDYVIKTVRATDDDRGDTIRYSLAQASSTLFEIDPTSGAITLAQGQSLNYETQAQHQISVIAEDRDSGGKSGQASFTLNLMDVNDVTPSLTASVASGSVRDGTAALLGGTDTGIRLILTDADGTATNAYTPDSFTITGTENAKFAVRQENVGAHREWGLYFVGETGIDFSAISGGEITLNITLTDTLTDGTTHTTPAVPVTITELTSTVTFEAGKGSRSIDDIKEGVENDVGDVLAMVEATSTASGPIKYAFLGGSQISGLFSINEDTGEIFYGADTTFDYEDANPNSYTLNVVATDKSNDHTATATIIVNVQDVNDHAPLFPRGASSATVLESHTAADGVITRVSAADRDGTSPNNQVTGYRISGGTGLGIFSINEDGEVSLNAGQTLDYDTAPASYTLEIVARDGGGVDFMETPDARKHTLTINLTDVNDIAPTYTESGEAMVRMTGVHGHNFRIQTGYSITIDDADTNNNFTFNLSDSYRFEFRDQGNGVWELFLIPDRVIDLAAGDIMLTYQLNDGMNDAVDGNGMVKSGSVNVRVVETSVRFTEGKGSQSIKVDDGEMRTAGTTLAVVEATALAPGTIITYAFEGGGLTSGLFSIDADSGIITYNADTNFDFEDNNPNAYTLKVVATNGGNKIHGTHFGDTATATITLNVIDLNEHTPTFPAASTTTTVAEAHTAADRAFITAAATDADGSAPNNALRYEIIDGNLDDIFTIDANGGISVVAGRILDYDIRAIYTLTIQASDGGTPPRTSATHEVNIAVAEATGVAAEYSITQSDRVLTAAITTPDPDGIKAGTTTRYQWFNHDTGDVLATTNTNIYTLPGGADVNGNYGVIITYTDGTDVRTSVIGYNFDKSVHVTPIDKAPTPQTTLTADIQNIYIGDHRANTATAPSTGNDAFYGLSGNDVLHGKGWNDVFYVSKGVDIFWGGAGSDVYVLDIDGAAFNNVNVDIVADFTHGHEHQQYDRIRVYVDDPSVITTLEELQTALGISFRRVHSSTTIHRDAADNPAIDNLHILNAAGTNHLMVIEDFHTVLFSFGFGLASIVRQPNLDMFEILSTDEKPTAAVHQLEITEHKGGANPLAQSILTMQSLKGATATIQGAYSDLFEVTSNGLGTYQLFIKENALLDHDTHGVFAFNIFFSEVKDVAVHTR